MSKKTMSQMEALLLDRIEKAKHKLETLQKKHKLEIGSLAYRHDLHLLTLEALDRAFEKIAKEPSYVS